MKIRLKNNNLQTLYKNNNLKEIINSYSFIVRIEKNGNIPITTRILNKESINIYMNAIIWDLKNPSEFQKYTGELIISYKDIKYISTKEIKNKLIESIYKQVIKNKIMMI